MNSFILQHIWYNFKTYNDCSRFLPNGCVSHGAPSSGSAEGLSLLSAISATSDHNFKISIILLFIDHLKTLNIKISIILLIRDRLKMLTSKMWM
jgi:hypothetical protein